MTDTKTLQFNPIQERLVEIMKKKTQNLDPIFFRLVVSYFFCKIASMMRTYIVLPGEENIPVNMYVINLAPSGSGKGHSIRMMENKVINGFRNEFLNKTFPTISETTLAKIGSRRSVKNRSDPDTELAIAEAEFMACGPLLFSFDSATTPAIKQMRTLLQMAGAGSINLEIDEIGSNLLGNTEALNAFLELFDVGQIKPKLIKHTRENQRSEDLVDPTPTNALLFGTPAKLLNGTKAEDEYYSMEETGYARRSFHGYSRVRIIPDDQTPEELLLALNDNSDADYLVKLSNRFALLASPTQFNTCMEMEEEVQLAFLAYRQKCQLRAHTYSVYQEAKQAEMGHRHFKCVKLAAAYAFIDSSIYMSMDHWEQAVALTELSGDAFHNILKRDKSYAKLARFIAGAEEQLTQADLVEELPFYRGTKTEKAEMMDTAIGYGYKQGIYIRRERNEDNIDFFSGKALTETSLDSLILSYSQKITEGYLNTRVPFDQLHQMRAIDGYHWVAHHLDKGYRRDENIKMGCNLAVIDVDDGVAIETAQLLLEDFHYIIHTTKRHTPTAHRFRIILPLSHEVELSSKDYKEFMGNIYQWMPFDCDKQTNDRARKWLSCKGKYWYNEGEKLEALQFIPKTKKAEQQRKRYSAQSSLEPLERWFINKIDTDGSRNTQLYYYACHLVDRGQDISSITNNVLALNNKLPIPLTEEEILRTVIQSASKKIHERDIKGK
jgi:hypothetical protein